MKISIDLRSLQTGSISGVENYTLNLLEHLLPMDTENEYKLFFNSWQKKNFGINLKHQNSKILRTRIPNKILNLAFKLNLLKFEDLLGETDILFMPNLNQFQVAGNTKLVLTVHDLSPVTTPEFYNTKRRLWHYFLNYKKAVNRANLILAVSKYTKLDLVRLFNINPDKIKVIYPGINTKKMAERISINKLRMARNIYGLPGDYLLFLNTIEPRKNLSNLIKAFEQIESPVSLVIAGKKGWKYKEVFKQIKNSKKSSKIKYLGYIREEDKPAIISMARALIYPSFYEGFGFQPLEAMALKTPTIVSQVTSLPEIVKDASLLVNPYNIQDLRSAISEIIMKEDLRQKLISKGVKRVVSFNWQLTANQVMEQFKQL